MTAPWLATAMVAATAAQAAGGVVQAAGTAEKETASSGTLVEDAGSMDGARVEITGEAIGEAMRRGAMAWIHLNDDAYMERAVIDGADLGGANSGMAVWLPAGMARRIGLFGGYGAHGDVVRVTGAFHAACREHGGDMDIHADGLTIVRSGHVTREHVSAGRLSACCAAVILTALVVVAIRKGRRGASGSGRWHGPGASGSKA